MKENVKWVLRKLRVYNYLKYSKIFAAYEKRFKPEVARQRMKEVSFYRSFLAPCDLIFDIGANDGHKTEAFLHIAQRIVCCEPDAANFKILQVRFRNKRQRVFLEKKAVAASEGTAQMYLHHEASAFNTLNEKFKAIAEQDELEKWSEKIKFDKAIHVQTTTLEHLVSKYGRPYFIKIDVEGCELEVLKGLKQRVPFISVECLLPEFWDELQQSLSLILDLDPQATFNIAVHEQLLFKNFKSYTETINFLTEFKEPHLELVIRMKV